MKKRNGGEQRALPPMFSGGMYHVEHALAHRTGDPVQLRLQHLHEVHPQPGQRVFVADGHLSDRRGAGGGPVFLRRTFGGTSGRMQEAELDLSGPGHLRGGPGVWIHQSLPGRVEGPYRVPGGEHRPGLRIGLCGCAAVPGEHLAPAALGYGGVRGGPGSLQIQIERKLLLPSINKDFC